MCRQTYKIRGKTKKESGKLGLLKDAGIPEGVVMELVGHDSKSMSAHYTHVGAEALEKAVAALPEI
jgi:integrase